MVKEIKYKGVYIDAYGYYEPYDAETMKPHHPCGYFELEKITFDKTDITELQKITLKKLKKKYWYEIENEEPFDE